MTPDSVAEQGGAGLGSLTDAELSRFDCLNAAYRAKFGFSFIVAVRGRGKADLLAEFERGLGHPPAAEVEAALDAVGLITRMRLERVLGPLR